MWSLFLFMFEDALSRVWRRKFGFWSSREARSVRPLFYIAYFPRQLSDLLLR
jgi:hypothetical protein